MIKNNGLLAKVLSLVKTVGPLFSPKTVIFKLAAILRITDSKK